MHKYMICVYICVFVYLNQCLPLFGATTFAGPHFVGLPARLLPPTPPSNLQKRRRRVVLQKKSQRISKYICRLQSLLILGITTKYVQYTNIWINIYIYIFNSTYIICIYIYIPNMERIICSYVSMSLVLLLVLLLSLLFLLLPSFSLLLLHYHYDI